MLIQMIYVICSFRIFLMLHLLLFDQANVYDLAVGKLGIFKKDLDI